MKIINAILSPLGKLLAPFVNRPSVQAVLIPVCAVAGGLQFAWSGSDPSTWQGKVAGVSTLVVTFCAAAGIASSGLQTVAGSKQIEESGEHPAAQMPEQAKPRSVFDRLPPGL